MRWKKRTNEIICPFAEIGEDELDFEFHFNPERGRYWEQMCCVVFLGQLGFCCCNGTNHEAHTCTQTEFLLTTYEMKEIFWGETLIHGFASNKRKNFHIMGLRNFLIFYFEAISAETCNPSNISSTLIPRVQDFILFENPFFVPRQGSINLYI